MEWQPRLLAQQAVVLVIDHCSPNGPIKVTASYDEFDIVIQISYFAPELVFASEVLSRDDVTVSLDSHRQLAGYLVARHADQVIDIRTLLLNAVQLQLRHERHALCPLRQERSLRRDG